MAEPTRFTVLFPDWHLGAYYSANNTFKRCKFYDQADGTPATEVNANVEMKLAFANACSTLGFEPRGDYHAIQYVDGEGEIEYANGHIHTTFSGNTAIAEFIKILDVWDKQVRVDENERIRLESIPTWDAIRYNRDQLLIESDGVFAYATETSNQVPQAWLDYRAELRNLPQTYGANTGNTELVVYPTKPTWPDWS